MARHVVSLSQMLENDNRRRENTLNINASRSIPFATNKSQPPQGMQQGLKLKHNQHRQMSYQQPMYALPPQEDFINLQSQPIRYASSSQQTAYTSEDLYSQTQLTPFSQDEAVLPLPSLLQSRYSRMLMESSEAHRVAQASREEDNSASSKEHLDAERQQQLMGIVQSLVRDKQKETEEKAVKSSLKKRKLDEAEQEKRERRDAKEQQRQHEHAEKLRRRQAKQEILREKDMQHEARKAEKAKLKQDLEDAKAKRKLEKERLFAAAQEAERAEQLVKEKAKETKRLAKAKAVAKQESEFRALSTRIWKLEHRQAIESNQCKTLVEKVQLLANTTKELLLENKKLVKTVQEHKKMVADTVKRLDKSVNTVNDAISSSTLDLLTMTQEWRERGAILPPAATTPPPPVNRMLIAKEEDESTTDLEVLAIVEPNGVNASAFSLEDGDPAAFGSTLAQDMIQLAREKRQRKQQRLRGG